MTVEQPRGPDRRFRRADVAAPPRASTSSCVRIAGASSADAAGSAASPTGCARGWSRPLARGRRGERRPCSRASCSATIKRSRRACATRFRASGLYHLLAVSGQNVALVAGGALVLAGVARGMPRSLGELGALAGIAAYVLAVGAQPSVIRAGVAGALGSLAWLAARQRDRWHFLLLAALVLLAWNPYTLLDAGFQLSFVAVASIFVLVPPLLSVLEGYPLPRWLAEAIAVSTACGVATAPIAVAAVPRGAAARRPGERARRAGDGAAARTRASRGAARLRSAPASPRCSPASPAGAPRGSPLCARLVGGLPFAQVHVVARRPRARASASPSSRRAYAWRRWQSSSRST